MREGTVSRTALGTAMGRALESARSGGDRLFEDAVAMTLLPARHRALVRLLRVPLLGRALLAMRERRIPGIMGNLLCRTRAIDDRLRTALARGCEQVLILGAGFDSRAFRIVDKEAVAVFEVDHPATQDWKRERSRTDASTLRSRVNLVPVNFETDDLGEALAAAGFRTDVETLVLWEGVTQYLEEAAVDATLRWISSSTAPGSEIVFTDILRGLVDGTSRDETTARFLAELEAQGEPWVFGIEPAELASFLADRGLELIEDIGAADYRSRYLNPTGRRMALSEGERIAVAEVRGA